MPILKGTIKDKNTGETLPGATVQIDDSGKVADYNGNFLFVLKNNIHKAIIRFLGYKTQTIEIPLFDNAEIEILLDRDTSILNQIEVKAKKTYIYLYVLGGAIIGLYFLSKWRK